MGCQQLEEVEAELAPKHGRHCQGLAAPVRETLEPAPDHVLHRFGNGGPPRCSRRACELLLGFEEPHDLTHKQRIALSVGCDRVD